MAAERQAAAAEAATGTGNFDVQDFRDQVLAQVIQSTISSIASPELIPPVMPALGEVITPWGYDTSNTWYSSNEFSDSNASLTFVSIYVPAGRPIKRVGIQFYSGDEGDTFRLGLYSVDATGLPRTRVWQSDLLPLVVDGATHTIDLDEPLELFGWFYATVELVGGLTFTAFAAGDETESVGFVGHDGISGAVGGSGQRGSLVYRRHPSLNYWGDSDFGEPYVSDGSLPETLTWQWERTGLEPEEPLWPGAFDANYVPAIFLGV